MSHDDSKRIADAPWRQVGPGMMSTLLCWTCNKPKHSLGGKRVGSLKLFKCAECLKK